MRKSSAVPSALLMIAIIGSIPVVLAQTNGGEEPNAEIRTYAAIGTISNLQFEEGTPAWIISGGWKLKATLTGEEDSTATFEAGTRMVRPDGTAMHTHEFSMDPNPYLGFMRPSKPNRHSMMYRYHPAFSSETRTISFTPATFC